MPDAVLAAVATGHGAEVVGFDRDFARLPQLRSSRPERWGVRARLRPESKDASALVREALEEVQYVGRRRQAESSKSVPVGRPSF